MAWCDKRRIIICYNVQSNVVLSVLDFWHFQGPLGSKIPCLWHKTGKTNRPQLFGGK